MKFNPHRWRILPKFIQLFWQLDPKSVSILMGFALLTGLFPVLELELLNRFVNSTLDLINGKGQIQTVLLLLGSLIITFYANHLFTMLNRHLGVNIQERLLIRVQERLMGKSSTLALSTFENAETFDGLERAINGLNRHGKLAFFIFFRTPANTISVVSLLIYVGLGAWFFPLILLLGSLIATVTRMQELKLRFSWTREQTPTERLIHYIDQLMKQKPSAAEVRLFGLENHFLSHRDTIYTQLRGTRFKMAREQMRVSLIADNSQAITYALVLILSIFIVVSGSFSLGQYAAYLISIERFQINLWLLLMTLSSFDNDLRYIGDMFDYLELEDDESRTLKAQAEDTLFTHVPTIVLENVSFTYPGSDKPSLNNINLTMSPSERIALVGENGAGKTTLAKLIMGLYQPTSGRITVDGVDLRTIDATRWRRCCAAVFQDFVKYKMTARENIGLGHLPYLQEQPRIELAATKSGAHEVIQTLPQRYDTTLGKVFDDQGKDLSGGQWQKLAIARAYLRDAQVLVLDEPTAALDARAEVEVYNQFNSVSQGKSAILISHRLGSARLANRIIVLEHGSITEEGTHKELLDKGGHYATMLGLQAQWYN